MLLNNLCKEQCSFFFLSLQKYVINHSYASSESGNLICFGGHTDHIVRPQYALKFYMAFSCTGKKLILWFSQYGNFFLYDYSTEHNSYQNWNLCVPFPKL